MTIKYRFDQVLRFNRNPKGRATVRRYYDEWRRQSGLPYRCDNENCPFHKGNLIWNNQQLGMILDHINGNRNDNRAENLRYLCPNCDAQLPTRGGRNRGRIINESDGGFQVKHGPKKIDNLVFPGTAMMRLKTHKAKIAAKRGKRNS